MRILLVSQMYPGPADPDLGTFVAQVEAPKLFERGRDVERAVLDRRAGGKRRYMKLGRTARAAARRFDPDVVYAHFLVPVRAFRRDARVGARRSSSLRTAATSATSARLQDRRGDEVRGRPGRDRGLRLGIPPPRARAEAAERAGQDRGFSSGVDLERFAPAPRAGRAGAGVSCASASLTPRKNVLRLARAFERLGEGTLTFAGDGPLRPRGLEGRQGVKLLGRIVHGDLFRPRIGRGDGRVSAEPDRAAWAGAPRGDGVRAIRARDEDRRPARVRHAKAGLARRPGRRGGPPRRAPCCRSAARLRTRRPARPPRPHDVKRQAERLEQILERAARDRRA